jgi:hypothetical protein
MDSGTQVNPFPSFDLQLSIEDPDRVGTVNLFTRPQQIGFPPSHPLKSPRRPLNERKLPEHHEATA